MKPWTTLVVPVETETRTIEVETPQQHNNGRSFVARVYDMCRNHNNGQGATIEEIMNVTGATDQNIRSRVSELRRAYGQGAIITHTQQANTTFMVMDKYIVDIKSYIDLKRWKL